MEGNGLQPDEEILAAADEDGVYVGALSGYPYMMTVDNVAEFLGQTRQAVTQYLREKRLRGVKSGRSWRIPKRFFIEFLKSNENTAA